MQISPKGRFAIGFVVVLFALGVYAFCAFGGRASSKEDFLEWRKPVQECTRLMMEVHREIRRITWLESVDLVSLTASKTELLARVDAAEAAYNTIGKLVVVGEDAERWLNTIVYDVPRTRLFESYRAVIAGLGTTGAANTAVSERLTGLEGLLDACLPSKLVSLESHFDVPATKFGAWR